MTVLEVIQRSRDYLARKGVDSPRLPVELVLARVLGLPRLELYLNHERDLADEQLAVIRGLVQRLGNQEPLQYVLGSTSFCGLELQVGPGVLIPRPETELLAERAWTFLNARTAVPSTESVSVFEFGAGSGCLAVAIAVKAPRAEVWAVDVSEAALTVARTNADAHGVAARVRFVHGDGFAAAPPGATFDLIVSNPPYVPEGEIDSLPAHVRDHEPRLALDGGADGLDFMRRLAAESGTFLKREGRLMVEMGAGQAAAVTHLFGERGWTAEEVVKDYGDHERLLIATYGCRY